MLMNMRETRTCVDSFAPLRLCVKFSLTQRRKDAKRRFCGLMTVCLLLMLAAPCFAAQDTDAMKSWEQFDFAKQTVKREQLKDVSLEVL